MLSKIDCGHPLAVMAGVVFSAAAMFAICGMAHLAVQASKRQDMAACREMCAPLVPKFDGYGCECVKQ